MADQAGTLEQLALAVGNALAPLGDRLASGQVLGLFSELGMNFPAALTNQSSFSAALQKAGAAVGQLGPLITQMESAIELEDAETIVSVGIKLVKAIEELIESFVAMANELPAAAAAVGVSSSDASAFGTQLVKNLLAYAIVRYLEGYHPCLLHVLTLSGIIDRDAVAGSGPNKPGHTERSLRLDRLGDFLTSPADELLSVFNWGAPGFDGSELLSRINSALAALCLPAYLDTSSNPLKLTAFYLTIVPKLDIHPPGLQIELTTDIAGGLSRQIALGSSGMALELVLDADVKSGTGIVVQPPGTFTVTPPSGSVSGSATVGIVNAPSDSTPIVILGLTGGSGLTAGQIKFGIGTSLNWSSDTNSAQGDLGFTLEIDNGKLFIDMSEADGFLSDVTSGAPIEATFGFAANWAPATGLHITGGAQLEIDLPLHLDLGPVTIDTIYVIGGVINAGLTLELSAALGVTLGPIQASADRVGLLGTLTFPQGGGNLGPANLNLGFKPPEGLGIEIDAGPAAGGGYISFDPSQGQYAGVLDVSLADIVQVKVIGVIDTKMPDGSTGFSFLLIITFDLPPIELGFGFTLNGVGGLGGINRTINSTALQAGFVAHSLDSILFPPDPIANAPEIISNLRNFFPVAQDRYVFGPMLEVGWGTPTLINLEIGVIVELPDPVVIVLLGLIDVNLPDADTPLIELHIDVLGTLDFGTKTLEIEGDLYDSSVLIYSMAGSLFFRICWGDDPNFIYSVGGFNPNFNTAGLDIPTMQRCTVSIGDGDNPRISASNYFAVTSNSLQFGADVQAYASGGGFTIQGYIGFDVLIIFSPFSFEFDFSASFSASFEGVNLLSLNVSGSFSGPRPWNLNGQASISILWWTISASVNLTWGDSTPVTIPQKQVLPDLVKALQAPGNWSAALPAGMTPAVSLSAPNPAAPILLVYPMGTLSVRENVVPLDFEITLYGNATPSDGNIFAISDVQINHQETTRQTFQEYFAPGQFNNLSDADKLSLPSFEPSDAGVTIGSSAIVSGPDSPRTVVYEVRYVDSPMSYSRLTEPYLMPAEISAALTRQGAGYLSPLKNTGLAKYSAGPVSAAITTSEEGFVIASTDDLSIRSDISSASGTTYFQARTALNSHLAANPADVGNLQIVTLYEVAA